MGQTIYLPWPPWMMRQKIETVISVMFRCRWRYRAKLRQCKHRFNRYYEQSTYEKRVLVKNKLNLLLKTFCTTPEHFNYLQSKQSLIKWTLFTKDN
jgi:hypothetical protein